ncbi:MAG: thymidine kinase [Ruthenibacterium lactatiformans]
MSRLGVERRVDIAVRPDMDPLALVRADIAKNGPLACVLTDESQFFTSWQAEQLFMVTVALNVPVICYGLRADFSLQGFPGSTRLLELAHNIEEMKTICQCGARQCSTAAGKWKICVEGAQVAIDMENNVQYESCPQCYFRERDAFCRKAAEVAQNPAQTRRDAAYFTRIVMIKASL